MGRGRFGQILIASAAPAVLLAAPAFFWAAPACAGAWTPDEGHGEVIATTFVDQASQAFDSYGKFTPTPLYRSAQANVYVAYGVTDWLTAIVRPGVQSSSLGARKTSATRVSATARPPSRRGSGATIRR